MKIIVTFELDPKDYGRFNKTSGSTRETTLDKLSDKELTEMLDDSFANGNDLRHSLKLTKIERE